MGPATAHLATKIPALQCNQTTHYQTCEKYQKRHYYTGVFVVALSTMVGGFIFADLGDYPWWSSVVLGALSLLAAVGTAILTFSRFAEWSARHQKAAVAYGAILREVEGRVSGAYSEEENKAYLASLERDWAAASAEAPITFLMDRKMKNENQGHSPTD